MQFVFERVYVFNDVISTAKLRAEWRDGVQ